MSNAMTEEGRLLELAERCERAAGPDRNVDCAIYAATANIPPRGFIKNGMVFDGFGFGKPVPAYTASIDAAMTLVPDGDCRLERENGEWWAKVKGGTPVAATAAERAICAAALRALAQGASA